MSSGCSRGPSGSAASAGSTNGRSRRTHSRPSSTKSSRTVVRAGLRNSAWGVSSNPITLTLSGMARPASCMARITPTARSSLPHSTAVTAGSAASTRPAWYPERGFQPPCSGSGTTTPASRRASCQPAVRWLCSVEDGMAM